MPKAEIKAKPELTVIKEEEIQHLLVPGEVGAVLELTVKDKEGKVTEHRVLKSGSFVRQFLELLYTQVAGVYYWKNDQPYQFPVVQVINTSGMRKPVFAYEGIFDCAAAAADQTKGIMVGTGTTAPTIDDYHLETRIIHGSGAGQLQYGGVAFGLPASDPTTSQFTITRNFANASGASITVNEIGLYVRARAVTYGGSYEDHYFMVIRDVISGGIVVPNGQTLTVNYREQAVV